MAPRERAPVVDAGSTAGDLPPWLARMMADGAAFDWRADLHYAYYEYPELVRAHFLRRRRMIRR